MLLQNIRFRSIIVLLGLSLLAACGRSGKDQNENQTAQAIPVVLSSPAHTDAGGYTVSGQVTAVNSADISTRVMGYITKLNLHVGDRVQKGQVLATISNTDILAKRAQADAMITEASAALANAQKDLDRFTALYRQQSATAKELDNVTLQYQSAKARVESAKQMKNEINAQLNYTTLTAPFSGTVTRKMAEAGSMANPGMPLLTIEQSGALEIDAFIPESVINQVKEGQSVAVSIPSVNKNFLTKIARINASAAFTGGQYTVRISIPEKEAQNLLSGMFAHISLPGIANNQVSDSAVWVPASSLVQRDQLTGLYTVSSANKALLRWVRTGKTTGNMVEIISGLNNRESFILKSSMPLYNGAPVSITK